MKDIPGGGGATVRSIVENFNSRGLTTKRGKPFNMNSFNALLKNRKYIGEYSYQDVVIPGGVPFIVSEDLFYRVQQRMEKNKRAPAIEETQKSCDKKAVKKDWLERAIVRLTME